MSDHAPTPALTPNQVVAGNLVRARHHRGWTQDEAAERLAPYIGTRWSKATFSAAERSADPEATRIRQFTADDVVAFAQAFDLPVWSFFLPPASLPVSTNPDDPRATLAPDELLHRVFGDLDAARELTEMLSDRIPDTELSVGLVGSVYSQALTVVNAAVARALGDTGEWTGALRQIADLLDAARREAAETMVADVRRQFDPDQEDGR